MISIIPAIDIIDGKCVRLSQGDYSSKTEYKQSPLDLAMQYEDLGIKRLHIVDLDGAKAGKIINFKSLEQIALKTKLTIDFGGGVKSENDVNAIFSSGAAMVTIGSMAVKEKELVLDWIKNYGNDKFLLGADVLNEEVKISAWTEGTKLNILDFIEVYFSAGFKNFFCTDISKDGMLQGISKELYLKILSSFPGLNLTASGGVSSLEDIEIAEKIGCQGIIIGKAIYEGKIQLKELTKFIA